jgi:hypothetical protein
MDDLQHGLDGRGPDQSLTALGFRLLFADFFA